MRKNIKMSMQVMILTGVFVIVCLIALFFSITSRTKDILQTNAINTMESSLNAQGKIMSDYIDFCETSLKNYAKSPELLELVNNQDDPEIFASAQTYTEGVFKELGWEGLFVSTPETKVLSHGNKSAVGMVNRPADQLDGYWAAMDATEDGFFNGGAFVSPSTGNLILNFRMGVYKPNGDRLAVFGGAPLLATVSEEMNSTIPVGLENASFSFIDTNTNLYVVNKDSSLLATEVTDANILGIIDGSKVTADNMYTFTENGVKHTAVYKMLDGTSFLMVMSDTDSEIYNSYNRMLNLLIISFIIAGVIMLVAVFISARLATSPLKRVGSAMHKLRDLDLTKSDTLDILLGGKSEVSEMATAMDRVTFTLNEVIKDVNLTSDQLNEVVKNVSEEAQNLVAIAENNAAVAEELTASIELTSTAIDVCSDKTNDARDYVAHINDKIKESLNKTKTLTEEIKKTKAETDKTLEMNTATTAETTNTIIQVVEDLKATNQIREIVDDIKDIASQTNLLSLNASIEAARAGEAGKGFAVVADEIRALSDQSNKAADEISLIVEGCIKATEDASKAFDKVKLYLEEDVSKTLEAFAGTITSYNDSVASVENAITEIADNSQNLNSSVDEIVVELDEIRKSIQDNDDGINSVAESNNEIQSVAEALTDNMIRCNEQAEDLTSKVKAFTVD